MRSEKKLKATSEQLCALSARLHSAREEEAARIAREIHDELGAAMSSLRWDLEDVAETISKSAHGPQLQKLQPKIETMMRLSDTTINTVRRIASELRPIALDALGLIETIEWQARQFQERTGIVVQCDCSRENVDLIQEQSTAAFRIFQEALTNILRHAQATRVNVLMKAEDGNFNLTISDNGRGITDDEKSGQHTLGLLGMRERAHLFGGKVDITGSEGKGTVVTVRIPISG
jgi:signal transduction histidine kinase